MSLEEELIKNFKKVDVEWGLLVGSNLKTDKEINVYVKKIDLIQKKFEEYRKMVFGDKKPSQIQTANCLFRYFWGTKPNRCGNNFLLSKIINAQLSKSRNQKIGDCVGLTSLYSVIGLREELNLSTLHSSKHVKSRLRDGDVVIDIENTSLEGFDNKEDEKRCIELPVYYLISSVYNSRGCERFDSGNFKGAIKDFNKAILINPNFGEAYDNRGNAKMGLGDSKGAIEDYEKAEKLRTPKS